jgi:hypothetical protein
MHAGTLKSSCEGQLILVSWNSLTFPPSNTLAADMPVFGLTLTCQRSQHNHSWGFNESCNYNIAFREGWRCRFFFFFFFFLQTHALAGSKAYLCLLGNLDRAKTSARGLSFRFRRLPQSRSGVISALAIENPSSFRPSTLRWWLKRALHHDRRVLQSRTRMKDCKRPWYLSRNLSARLLRPVPCICILVQCAGRC